MTQLERPTLRIPGKIACDLGAKIVSGRLKPGMVLEGEVVASDLLKVSRSAYREAIRILVAKGLVTSRPKAGTTVSDRHCWHLLDPDVLSWIFQAKPDLRLLDSLFELRRTVEPEVAALAARRRSPRHLRAMQAALQGMAKHTLATKEGREADKKFHAALLDASENDFLVSLSTSILAAITWTNIYKQRLMPLRRDPVPDHRKVYEAVAIANAPAARKAMTEHLDLAFFDTKNFTTLLKGKAAVKRKRPKVRPRPETARSHK